MGGSGTCDNGPFDDCCFKCGKQSENHKKTIEALDEKKADILKLTATSAAASTAIAAIPGDATTPIANKLTDLTSYFLIILVVIFWKSIW